MTIIFKILPLAVLLVFSAGLYAMPLSDGMQQQADSILALISPDQPDSVKARHYNHLATVSDNIDSRREYAQMSLDCCHEDSALVLDNYAILANCYYVTQKIDLFWSFIYRGLDMAERCGNGYYIQRFYKMLSIYYDQHNNSDSMFYFINKALEINVVAQDSVNMALCYQELGLKFANRYAYRDAEDSYRKAMQLDSMLNQKIDYAVDCYRLGELFTLQADDSLYLSSAKKYLLRSVKMFDSLKFDNYKYSIYKHLAYNSLSNVYIILADKYHDNTFADSCYFYNKQSRDFFHKSGYDDYYSCYVSFTYLNYLNYYKRYKEALNVLLTLKPHIDDGNIDLLDYYYMSLHSVYASLGDYKNAYNAFEKYFEYNSELKNDSTMSVISDTKTEQAVMIERIKHEAEQKLYESEASKHQTMILSLVIVLLLVSVFVVFVLRALGFKKKANSALSEKNELLSQQKNEIAAQRDEIAMQRDQIEMVNTELMRSISYAERIQRSTVPSVDEVKKIFPDCFIIYRPRDIVSGDFFRAEKCGRFSVMVLADCTGHGIPGAFLSMLGISALKEYLVTEQDADNPGTVLDRIRDFVKSTLSTSYDGEEINDGMDMTIFCFDPLKMQLRYAIANQKAVHVRDGAATKLSGDKMPVGRSLMEREHFQTFTLHLRPCDMLYLFSDGVHDQFGGENQKKFKLVTLVDTLVSVSERSLSSQSTFMEQIFTAWRGTNPQIDDMTLIGIRV